MEAREATSRSCGERDGRLRNRSSLSGVTARRPSTASSTVRRTSTQRRVSGHREHLRGAPRCLRAQVVFRIQPEQAQAEMGSSCPNRGMGTNFRSKAFHDVPGRIKDRIPRSILGTKRSRRSTLYDLPGRHLRHIGRRTELARRPALPPYFISCGLVCRVPRQPHGQDLWNEQWRDGRSGAYAESSNVENAYRLRQSASCRGRARSERRSIERCKSSVISSSTIRILIC